MEDNSIRVYYGEKIKLKRKELGMTRKQLASSIKMSEGFLADVENGRSFPPLGKTIELAKELGVTTSWLLGEAENDEENKNLLKAKAENIDRGSFMYEMFLNIHKFPNGMTYKEMCEKIEQSEELEKKLSEFSKILDK